MKQLQWFNEPEEWKDLGPQSLSMFVTPQTDYWRKTYYGFTVDDGPFYYAQLGGEFEMKVKITGAYNSRYDQMGIMIRIDERNWIKAGVEYVDQKMNISAVVTRELSDWSMIELIQSPTSIWIKAIRRLDAIKLYYSLDGQAYALYRLAHFPEGRPVSAGLTAASPDGMGFNAHFEEFEIKHLPDSRRLDWLEKNHSED